MSDRETTPESLDPQDASLPVTDPVAAKQPGAQLAALREANGWTVEQVAAQLNLAVRQVQAIESDNYQALPGMAVTRGFMRAYAKLLKTDPAPLLALLPEQTTIPNATTVPRKRSFEPTPITREHQPASKRPRRLLTNWKAGVLLVVAVLIAAAVLERKDDLPYLSATGLETTGTATTQPPATATVDESAVTTPSGDSVAANNPAIVPASPPAPADAAPSPAAPAAAVPDNAQTSSSMEDPLVLSRSALVLKFREDSWVEITREDDRNLMSRLIKAGSTETIKISKPASVVIGNASGVDAFWRGQPLDLKSGAKGNVARLNLK